MPEGILGAIQAISALISLIGNASTAVQQINATISAAQAGGRDLTDAELQAAVTARQAAEASLLSALGASPAPKP